MRVQIHYRKTGDYFTYTCDMDCIPRVGDFIHLHPLRYVESVPREVVRVIFFAKEPDDDNQVDVKIEVS